MDKYMLGVALYIKSQDLKQVNQQEQKHQKKLFFKQDFHSAALSANGDLFTWGGGGRDYNRGQLGHGHLNDVETPQVVKDNIVKFSCGGYHMMALDKDDELWS
ncbi:unnamed protein product [Paramecium primaurelia]|uniref:Uncharacterized protein n=1 Tax=Paramecium primaurelia TaxID=5886 RepID=A0A8S1PTV0_PARPR|nr:unnamed protein product [Paramecium primaurelia]